MYIMNCELDFINKQQSGSCFGILSAVLLKIEVFGDVTLFRLVNTQLLMFRRIIVTANRPFTL